MSTLTSPAASIPYSILTVDLDWTELPSKITRYHYNADHTQTFKLRSDNSILQVFRNGVRQIIGVDFVRHGDAFTFISKLRKDEQIGIEEIA